MDFHRLANDEVALLREINYLLKQVSLELASGGAMQIGDTVGGGTADRVLYIDNSGNLYGDAKFTRDSTTNYTNFAATVDTGVESSLQVNNNLLSTGLKGVMLETNSADISTAVMVVDGLAFTNVVNSNTSEEAYCSIESANGCVLAHTLDAGDNEVKITVNATTGVEAFGLGTTADGNLATTNAFIAQNGDADHLLEVRNDGQITLSNLGGSGSGLVAVSNTGVLSFTSSSLITGTDTQVLFFDGNNNPAGDADFTWSKTTNTLTVANLNPLGVTGTNATGTELVVSGGAGTGSAFGGGIVFQTSIQGTTGTTPHSFGERYLIAPKSVTLTESTATTFCTVNLPSNTIAGGTITYSVVATDGTDFQGLTGIITWTAVNKAGTLTIQFDDNQQTTEASSSGTLTNTITVVDGGSGNLQFKADAASSLTQIFIGIRFQALNNGEQNTITSA